MNWRFENVPKSEMPKGVEHWLVALLLLSTLKVPKSEMPKGVEHDGARRQSSHTRWCVEVRDAERR